MKDNVKNIKEKNTSAFFSCIEKIGNKLPHSVFIFISLAIIVIFASEIVHRMGISVSYFDAKAGKDVVVTPVSLMNREGFVYMVTSMVKNFTGFAPLGVALVAIIGVGVAEYSGLIDAFLKKIVMSVSGKYITAAVVFVGIISNIAADSGYLVVIPLGGIIFMSLKRHPFAGIAAAFAGVSAGFSANLLIGPIDAQLAGLTNEALKASGIEHTVSPTANWFFLALSTLLLTVIGTFITEKIVEPKLGKYKNDNHEFEYSELTENENKGLFWAGISLLLFIIVMAFLIFPKNALLKTFDPKTSTYTLNSYLSSGIVPTILFFFLIPGIVYGKITKSIKDGKDIVKGMNKSMESMSLFLVIVFFAAQFISYFNHSKLGFIISVKGAIFLRNIGFTGLPLIITFVFLCAFINLFMASASAKWAIMAPIFIPMMYNLNISPEVTQLAYRIGDSSTNIIMPLMSYFPLVVAYMNKYDEDAGVGTLISIMLPYSLSFLIGWTLMLILWYTAKIPIGPGVFFNVM
ncbi:MAG: AbgT family transporter [Leptotrichiaceae bacterium]|nr:AbgT family transporter [Leptotrichiaceae bacterium]